MAPSADIDRDDDIPNDGGQELHVAQALRDTLEWLQEPHQMKRGIATLRAQLFSHE
jgi:hypothetical protein